MPRAFTAPARAAMLDLSTAEAFLALVTISHPGTGTVFRVVMNTEPVTSRGNTFAPYAFRFQLPTESGEEYGQVGFEIDNTDLALVDMLRAVVDPVQFVIEIVLASNPDQVELAVHDLVLREVEWDAAQVRGKLILDDVLNQRFPRDVFDPIQYAGLF
jgi:hypothetical protein